MADQASLERSLPMCNYTVSNVKYPLLDWKPTFWLHFHMQGVGVEWMDEDLPIPNYLKYANIGFDIAWQINGYFGTQKGIEYLNDVIGKVLVSFAENKPERLPWKPDIKSADHYYPKIYKLKQLNIRSVSIQKREAPRRADSYDDHAFWAIKLYTEDLIRSGGVGVPIVYEHLEAWALRQFENKERSTIRAKCRSVWNWYDERDWDLPKRRKYNDEELLVCRQENMKRVNVIRKQKSIEKIKSVISDLTLQDQIKMKNGKFKISAIAKLAGMDRDTVSKHLKDMGLV